MSRGIFFVQLCIIDNSGGIISQQTIIRNSIAETNNIPVHLEKLSSGVYYIQLQQKEKNWWQKIILQIKKSNPGISGVTFFKPSFLLVIFIL